MYIFCTDVWSCYILPKCLLSGIFVDLYHIILIVILQYCHIEQPTFMTLKPHAYKSCYLNLLSGMSYCMAKKLEVTAFVSNWFKQPHTREFCFSDVERLGQLPSIFTIIRYQKGKISWGWCYVLQTPRKSHKTVYGR